MLSTVIEEVVEDSPRPGFTLVDDVEKVNETSDNTIRSRWQTGSIDHLPPFLPEDLTPVLLGVLRLVPYFGIRRC
jgi:hypothetical protein